jgi:hypothetical protein
MKQPTYFCDNCNIEKFDSETQTYKPQSFSCNTRAHYHQHIDTTKHILNTIIYKNLEDNLIVECKHCKVVYTKEQYKQHSQRNSILWALKTNENIYRFSVCNHFVYNDKRFNSIKIMKEFVEQSTRYKKEQTKKNKLREQLIRLLNDKELAENLQNERRMKNKEKLKVEMDVKNAKKKEKEAKENTKKEEKRLSKIIKNNKPKTIEEKWANEVENTDPGLKLEILPMLKEPYYEEEEEAEEGTPKQIRQDYNIPPIIDEDDICEDCGYTQNFIVEYPEEKLERYGFRICECSGTTTEDESE